MKYIINSFTFLISIILILLNILYFSNIEELQIVTGISRLICNWLFFLVSFLCIGYFFLLRKKCGKLSFDYIWLIIGIMLLLRGINIHFSIERFGLLSINPKLYIIFHVICLLLLLSFVVANIIITINCFKYPKHKSNYLIIHGAKSGSKVLDNRIKTSVRYLKVYKDTIAIGSGGKGKDEYISEAKYIGNKLKKNDISESRILYEDKSTTTYENLLFSKKLMKDNASFIVCSDDYHIFRTKMLAKKVFGIIPEGLPVHSSRVSLPYYVLREYFSIVYNLYKGNLL